MDAIQKKLGKYKGKYGKEIGIDELELVKIYYRRVDFIHNTTPDPESSLVKMSESGHFTVINLIN